MGWLGEALRHADDEEDGDGDDQKVDDGVEEVAVIDGNGTGLLGFRQRGIMRSGQADEEVGKIDSAEEFADRGHDDVRHQGGDDFAESTANDDSDGQIEDVTAHNEGLEIFPHMVGNIENTEVLSIHRGPFRGETPVLTEREGGHTLTVKG